jgi:hypothetical protein
MRLRTIFIKSFLLSIGLFGVCSGQAPKVEWSSFNMGYAVSSASGTVIRSAVGQSFVGRAGEGNSFIESGFLADTLLRGAILGVTESPMMPMEYRLEQNYPNPFNPETVIRYSLLVTGPVTLKVYDVLGREMATLVDEVKQPGEHRVLWNAGNYSSGVYFYRLQAGSYSGTKRLLLLK